MIKIKSSAELRLMMQSNEIAAQALARETFLQDVDCAALRARLVEEGKAP